MRTTEQDISNLADIAWFLHGYIAMAKAVDGECPFTPEHIESISHVRLDYRDLKESDHGDKQIFGVDDEIKLVINRQTVEATNDY